MKEIRLPYSEYKEMIDLIDRQNEALQKIEEEKGVVVIDRRYNHYQTKIDEVLYNIPEITGKDEAELFLKKEFDDLYRNVAEIKLEFERLRHYRDKKESNKSWWN